MKKTLAFAPVNVCARKMEVKIEDGKIVSFVAEGGCQGNLRSIASLIKGMEVEDVIAKLEGITCRGSRTGTTSCGDQLARALKEMK